MRTTLFLQAGRETRGDNESDLWNVESSSRRVFQYFKIRLPPVPSPQPQPLALNPQPSTLSPPNMKFYVGTSGYSYKEWKGSFYPEKLPQKKMLSYYA